MAKFKPGQSGNPAGRPRGTKDTRTELRELLRPHAPALVAKVVALALDEGDVAAPRICVERLIPALKPQSEPVSLPGMRGTLSERGNTVLGAMARGRLSPDEAATVLQALAAQARIREFDDLASRIAELEAKVDERKEPVGKT